MNSALDRFERSLVEASDRLSEQTVREGSAPGAPPPPRRHRSRGRMVIGAAASVGLVGAAAGVVLAARGGGSADSTWDQHVLRAAEIALPKPAPNTIVHVAVTQTMTPSARHFAADSAATVDAQGWFQQGGASRWVTRETLPGGHTIWQTDSRIYDAGTHRVYEAPSIPSGDPRYSLARAKRHGTYVLRIDAAHGRIVRQTVSAAEAHALRTGADQISWAISWNGHHATLMPMVAPSARTIKRAQSQQPNETSLTFAAQLHRLLQSGHAHVAGRVTIDGRAAIKIDLPGAQSRLWMIYYVDPTTYTPIELDSYGFGNPNDRTRDVFHTYQRLSTRGNARLLQLSVPAGTAVDHSPAAFFRHLPTTLFIW